MKNLVRSPFAAVAITASLWFMSGCHQRPEEPAKGGELVMRQYTLPRPYGPELVGILQGLLWRGDKEPQAGRVALSPNGTLLVAAPAGFHAGVEQLVEGMKNAPATPPPSIRITYWAVGSTVASKPSRSAELDEVARALDALTNEQGPATFTLLEKLSLTSLSSLRADVSGVRFKVTQTGTAYDDKVLVNLDIGTNGSNHIETRVQLPFNKMVVLAQSGLDPWSLRSKQPDRSDKGKQASEPDKGKQGGEPDKGKQGSEPEPGTATLLYVLRAQLATP